MSEGRYGIMVLILSLVALAISISLLGCIDSELPANNRGLKYLISWGWALAIAIAFAGFIMSKHIKSRLAKIVIRIICSLSIAATLWFVIWSVIVLVLWLQHAA